MEYSNSILTQFSKDYSLEIWVKHLMVLCKIDKSNLATRKYYHLKLSTRKKQLTTRKTKFLILQLFKHNLQLVKLSP